MKKLLLSTVAGLALATQVPAAPTKLVDLAPTKVEFGMIDAVGELWGLATGPGVIDLGTWGGRQHMPWPDGKKIVKALKPGFKLEEGKPYSSFMPDGVAVEGDFKTGVCLLAMSNGMYHWYEYKILPGMKKFTANVYFTDDVGGRLAHIVAGQAPSNQDVIFRVIVDGKTVHEKHHNRMQVQMGAGTLIEKLAVDLPKDAQVIRFYIESTTFPNNLHNEVLIADGVFE
jgi:hypothetical protein